MWEGVRCVGRSEVCGKDRGVWEGVRCVRRCEVCRKE